MLASHRSRFRIFRLRPEGKVSYSVQRETFVNFRTSSVPAGKRQKINEGCEVVSAVPTSAADQPLVKEIK